MSRTSHAKHEHKNKKSNQAQTYEKPHEDYQAGKLADFIIGFLILGLGIFFIVPFYPLMSSTGQIIAIVLFLLVVLSFMIVVWRKRRKKKQQK